LFLREKKQLGGKGLGFINRRKTETSLKRKRPNLAGRRVTRFPREGLTRGGRAHVFQKRGKFREGELIVVTDRGKGDFPEKKPDT